MDQEKSQSLQGPLRIATAAAELLRAEGLRVLRNVSMRHSCDRFRVVFAAIELHTIVACGSESVTAKKVFTTESIVFLYSR